MGCCFTRQAACTVQAVEAGNGAIDGGLGVGICLLDWSPGPPVERGPSLAAPARPPPCACCHVSPCPRGSVTSCPYACCQCSAFLFSCCMSCMTFFKHTGVACSCSCSVLSCHAVVCVCLKTTATLESKYCTCFNQLLITPWLMCVVVQACNQAVFSVWYHPSIMCSIFVYAAYNGMYSLVAPWLHLGVCLSLQSAYNVGFAYVGLH